MSLIVEDKPVLHCDPIMDEAAQLLRAIKVGQSFLIPVRYASAIRNRAKLIDGTFRTVTEGDNLRIGRVA